MLAASIPAKISVVWASGAAGSYIRTVPNTTADPNAASFTLGFPPNVFVDVAAGGKPPDGRDVNYVGKFASGWSQWVAAGGPIKYDSTFSTAIGGYPKGALVQDVTTLGVFWLCTADNTTTAPGGAGWQNLFPQTITGNAATASKWSGAITVTASGDVSGSAAFDGSANATFAMTVATIAGDAGFGGIKGLAPAPPAGSAALRQTLHGDGTFSGGYSETVIGVVSAGQHSTFSHGLGVNPTSIRTFMRCDTGNAGYSAGVYVEFSVSTPNLSQGVQTWSLQDATNVGWVVGGNGICLLNASTGFTQTITLANWSLIVRCFVA